jgi:seryl-tRNA synthetase
MLDIRYIRDNAAAVTEKSKQKGYEVDVQKLLGVDENRRKLLGEIERLRAERNELADKSKAGNPESRPYRTSTHS